MDTGAIYRALRELIADGLGAQPASGVRVQLQGVTVEVQVKCEQVVLELPPPPPAA